MLSTVQDVLEGRVRNAHVMWGPIQLYIRNSRRFFRGAMVKAADVASIEVPEELRGQGLGAAFFDFWEQQAFDRGLHVYVESILNLRFRAWLLRRGYTPCSSDPSSVFLPPKLLEKS